MNINLTIFMQAVAFAAFIWFTARFIWPPLMRAVDTRQKQIADGLAAGEQGKKELASAEKRIADMLAEAKLKASEIIATGEKFRSEMVRFSATVVGDARVAAALDNPRLSAGDKEALVLSIAADKLSDDGRSFLRVLIEADRITLLPQIAVLFDLLKNDAERVAKAT